MDYPEVTLRQLAEEAAQLSKLYDILGVDWRGPLEPPEILRG